MLTTLYVDRHELLFMKEAVHVTACSAPLRNRHRLTRISSTADAAHADTADGKAEWLWGTDGTLEGNANAPGPEFNALPADSKTVAALRQRKRRGAAEASANGGGASASSSSAASAGSAVDRRVGFKWRPGDKRMTTGIWLWSTPYIRKLPGTNEEVAVLLMDTQGMFDSETSMNLTVSIFGLSALLASYQIYNVLARVQEDNLQHLATWAAYGRSVWQAAVEADAEAAARHQNGGAKPSQGQNGAPASPPSAAVGGGAAAGLPRSAALDKAAATARQRSFRQGPRGGAAGAAAGLASAGAAPPGTPYQRLEFLVRDAVLRTRDVRDDAGLRDEMSNHLNGVMNKTHLEDLRVTRDQIFESFEDVSCYMLPHPGFEVSENDQYDGAIQSIRDTFRILLERYVHTVFTERLAPKRLHGRDITASELMRLVKTYAHLFQEGKSFPEPKSLLMATSEANNRNAFDSSVANFRKLMDNMAGAGKPHVREGELNEHADRCTDIALEQFDSVCAEELFLPCAGARLAMMQADST